MNYERERELEYMLRTHTAIPVVETRKLIADNCLYDDHYTLTELIEIGLVEYVGQSLSQLYVRPKQSFKIYVTDQIKQLTSGEIVLLQLGDDGKREFDEWKLGLER